METQIDHNAYSALFSDSEESESEELSALLANTDLDIQKALSIRELQERALFLVLGISVTSLHR